MAEAPADTFVTVFEDSRRWRNIERRPNDIIISTPPKCGTTWMQGIVRSLLWPAGDAPGSTGKLSPWVDMRMTPIDDLAHQLDAQEHQRFLKTHSPGDCIPFDQSCRYIVVYRDGRDALVSWGNHRATMRSEIIHAINHVAAKSGVAPIDTEFTGDYDRLMDEWEMVGSPIRHLAPWWARRHEPNVLFVHYADLTHDLHAEMRRIADYLGLEVEASQWPAVVDRCRLDSMRAAAEAGGQMDGRFDGGAGAFFYKGTNGRWRDILTDAQIERYLDQVERLETDAAIWLEYGSLAVGARPDEIGVPPVTVETARSHPVFGRLAKQQVNSLHAIAERRVEQARADGLFDDLALHGKPIPDIDRHRQPGWWANQFVAKERSKVRALQLEEDLRAAMPALWRLETEDQVQRRVVELNATIDTYNRVTTLAPMDHLDLAATLVTWRELKNRQP